MPLNLNLNCCCCVPGSDSNRNSRSDHRASASEDVRPASSLREREPSLEDAIAEIALEPAEGLRELAEHFVQKTLYCMSMHAMEHRESGMKLGRRLQSMETIKRARAHFKPDTLKRIEMNEPRDKLGRCFLAYLNGEEEKWNPPLESGMVRRRRSLRAIADEAYAQG
jgi:hypothetical protein